MDILNTGTLALRIAQLFGGKRAFREVDWVRLQSGYELIDRTLRASNFYESGTVERLDPEALTEFQYASRTLLCLQLASSLPEVKNHIEEIGQKLKSALDSRQRPIKEDAQNIERFFRSIGTAMVRERLDIPPSFDSPLDDITDSSYTMTEQLI